MARVRYITYGTFFLFSKLNRGKVASYSVSWAYLLSLCWRHDQQGCRSQGAGGLDPPDCDRSIYPISTRVRAPDYSHPPHGIFRPSNGLVWSQMHPSPAMSVLLKIGQGTIHIRRRTSFYNPLPQFRPWFTSICTVGKILTSISSHWKNIICFYGSKLKRKFRFHLSMIISDSNHNHKFDFITGFP